jgi:anti-anti-sigma regulatory factor
MRVTRTPQKNRALLTLVCQTLEMSDLFEFQAACMELLETGQPDLVIDARALHSVTSVFLGSIVKTSMQARESNQRLAVCAREEVTKLLVQLVGENVVEMRTTLPEED